MCTLPLRDMLTLSTVLYSVHCTDSLTMCLQNTVQCVLYSTLYRFAYSVHNTLYRFAYSAPFLCGQLNLPSQQHIIHNVLVLLLPSYCLHPHALLENI